MSAKRIDYRHQVTVCINKKTGINKFSLRNQGHLFWTGLEKDKWIDESIHGTEGDYIFETSDRNLVYAIKPLLEYSLEKSVHVQQLIDEL